MGPDTFCPTKPRLSRESQNLLITPRVKAPGPWPDLRLLKPRLGALAPPVFPEAWALCRGWSRDVLQQGSFQMLPSMWREGEPPGLPSPPAPLQALESPKIRQVSSGLRRKSILSSPTFPEYPKNSPGKTTLLSIGQGKLKQLLYLTKNTSCCHDNLCSKIRNASHSGVAAIKRAAGKCLSIHQSSGWGGELGAPARPTHTPDIVLTRMQPPPSGGDEAPLCFPPVGPTVRPRGFCPADGGSPSTGGT